MLDMIHYRKFLFTKLQRKSPCSENPTSNSCHESNTSNPYLPSHIQNMAFCISSNHYVAAQLVQRHTLDDPRFNCCIQPLLLLYYTVSQLPYQSPLSVYVKHILLEKLHFKLYFACSESQNEDFFS